MTDDEFKEKYPTSHFNYIPTSERTQGHMGQIEITPYDIVEKSTGQIVYRAIHTETTKLRGRGTTETWT